MFKLFIVSAFLLLVGALQAQEICDNGIDDDGDGAIDLNDSECACDGIVSAFPSVNVIPNGSFEDFDCCPDAFSQLYCSQGWESANIATPDLHHACNYMGQAGVDAGLLPPPNGNGAGGFIASPEWKEYLSICLDAPIPAQTPCFMSLDIASMPWDELGVLCAGGEVFYGDFELSVYGNTQCQTFPQLGFQCLLPSSTGWQLLGSVTYSPASAWSGLTLDFTLPFDVSAIAIGAPCNLPASYVSIEPFCYPYFLVDNIELLLPEFGTVGVTVTSTGNLCDENAVAFAETPAQGGAWQWYLEGVAIQGQNGSALNVSQLGLPPGEYTAVYTLNGSCAASTALFSDPDSFVSSVTAEICANESFQLQNGDVVTEEGSYTVFINNGTDCDSVVNYLVTVLPLAQTSQALFLCPGDSLFLSDGSSITQPGNYSIVFEAANGCDSLTVLEVIELQGPEAFFTYFVSDLSSNAEIQFNNLSQGADSVQWVWGNLTSNDETPQWTLESGDVLEQICLTAFSSDGCDDTVCISLEPSEEFTFYCPNAFTPNDDNRNEGFRPVVRGYDPGAYLFEVWNRWGERIFMSNSPNEAWIGNYLGGDYYVPNGVYLWRAKVKPLTEAEVFEFNGHVVVIR